MNFAKFLRTPFLQNTSCGCFYTGYCCRIKSYLCSSEAKALRNLTKQTDIIIQKAYKGDTEGILDNESYIEKMKELLSETGKFERLEIPPDKHLKFAIDSQEKMKNIFKSLHCRENLTDMLYKKI